MDAEQQATQNSQEIEFNGEESWKRVQERLAQIKRSVSIDTKGSRNHPPSNHKGMYHTCAGTVLTCNSHVELPNPGVFLGPEARSS